MEWEQEILGYVIQNGAFDNVEQLNYKKHVKKHSVVPISLLIEKKEEIWKEIREKERHEIEVGPEIDCKVQPMLLELAKVKQTFMGMSKGNILCPFQLSCHSLVCPVKESTGLWHALPTYF